MNLLTIIILLVLLVFMIDGYRKGFVRTLTAVLFFLLSGVLVYYATPYISDFLKTKTPVYQVIETQCEKVIQETQENEIPRKDQSRIIKSLPLPESVKTELLDHNNSYEYEKMAAETFSEYLSGYLAGILLNMITYILAFMLVSILLRVAADALNIMAHLPVIRGANRIAGLFLGAAKGIGVVWIFFLAATIFMNTEFGGQIMEMIKESPILSILYDANFFLKYLLKL